MGAGAPGRVHARRPPAFTCATPSSSWRRTSSRAPRIAERVRPARARGAGRLGMLGLFEPRRHAPCQRGGSSRPPAQRCFTTLMMCLRGSACIYQGEELGLPEADVAYEDLQDPYGIQFWPEFKGRDGCRTPMVWEPSNDMGGFSSGAEARPWLPVAPEHLNRCRSPRRSATRRRSSIITAGRSPCARAIRSGPGATQDAMDRGRATCCGSPATHRRAGRCTASSTSATVEVIVGPARGRLAAGRAGARHGEARGARASISGRGSPGCWSARAEWTAPPGAPRGAGPALRAGRTHEGGPDGRSEADQCREGLRRNRRGPEEHQPRHRAGRAHRLRRPVGLRQVHAAAHDRGAGEDLGRHARDRRHGRQRCAAKRSAASRWCSSPTRSTRT